MFNAALERTMFADDLDRLAALHAAGKLSDEEFARAKARVLGEEGPAGASSPPAPGPVQAVNSLRRSRDDRWLGGVCGGLARVTSVEAWIWRILFVIAATFGGCGIAAYLLLWIFVPAD